MTRSILHACVIPGQAYVFLWMEDATIRDRPRQGKRGEAPIHPFAMDVFQLRDRLSDVYPDFADFKLHYYDVVMRLPGARRHVQPSPLAQAAGVPAPVEEQTMLDWEVPGLAIMLDDVVDFFANLPPETETDGVLYGSSLVYYREVVHFALRCIAEGHYIPALAHTSRGMLSAYWEVRPPEDQLQALAAAMPPSARAIALQSSRPTSASSILRPFMTVLVDSIMRGVTSNTTYRYGYNRSWDDALISHNPMINLTPKKTQQLYTTWESWQLQTEPTPYRLCVRLDEPLPGENDWRLVYHLQSQVEASTLIPLGEIWYGGESYDYVRKVITMPRQFAMSELHHAASIVPAMERSMDTRYPTFATLSATEAHHFLIEEAERLKQQGITVLVPDWWTRAARLKIKGKMTATEESLGFLSKESLFNFEWQVAIGESTVSRDEFEQMVALKQPLVQIAGQWVALDEKQLRAAQNFFESQPETGEMNLFDALHATANGGTTEHEEIEVTAIELEKQVEKLLKKLRKPARASKIKPPKQLQAELRPYQERGLGWLVQMRQSGLGACLADDMGLGKTIQTIALWLYEREKLDVTGPALLICPTSVVGNWAHELVQFAPTLRVMTHHGPTRLQDEAFTEAVADLDVVITSYALMHRDLDTLLSVKWDSVTLDEAQNIKNPSTKQAQAARKLPANFHLALTGTPIENRLSELWSIFQFLNPGYLGSRKAFTSRFATPIEKHADKDAARTLRQLIAPFILRREKTDPKVIQDLPDKYENRVYCTLSAEQVSLYEAIVRRELDIIANADNPMARRGAVLRMLVHLKQVCNHPSHYLKQNEIQGQSGKLDRLHDLLSEIRDSGERALLFTQYARMGRLLQLHLSHYFKRDVLFLHGGTPGVKRAEMVADFQRDDGPPVFILSLKAGGTGLNLTAASQVIHYDRWYNPAVENQATDRAYRIGQNQVVQVHKLISIGTLEERIDKLIERKKSIADQVIGGGEAWLSELSDSELRDLVMLRTAALEG